MKALITSSKITLQQLVTTLVFLGLLVALLMHSASALAKGYATDDPELLPGMVAALSDSSTPDESKVERATLDEGNPIIGVVASLGSELVTFVSAPDQVYVQSTGEVDVFVSDLNGEVGPGDQLVLSPLHGILMKAQQNSTAPIVAAALGGFDAANAETRTVQTNSGTQDVRIGKVKVSLDYRAFSSTQTTVEDSALRQLGRAITGQEVGEIRVLAGLIIFIIVLVAEGGIIYGAVSSSITALGRNPLAKQVITKEAARVILVAVLVLGLGVLAIYAVLWL